MKTNSNLKAFHLFIFLFFIVSFSSCIKEPAGGGGGGTGGGGGSTLAERIILDTAYGADPKQKMDIYLPAGRTTATKVIILIHGGGWESGDKSEMNYYKNLLRAKWPDAAIANINYRLTSNPAVHYTQIMNDVTASVNMMVNNKTNFVISDTLTMVGASAGAHLAMLYTYKYNSNNYVKAVADFFGPAKLSDWSWYNSFNPWVGKAVKDVLIQFNGAPWDVPLYDSNSPYSVATAQSKPTIIFHGTIDVIVPLYQSQWLRAQLNTLGVPNEYYEYFLDGHGFNNTNTDDAMNKTVAFLKAHLR
ncbi:MAG: alpha/beta hydrolase [Ferruginibacter sp.]|nr:alpha/beta hydrolase [Ferruginibacter sp.]